MNSSPALTECEEKPVVGVVMAGGLSRRMGGGDKFDLKLNGKTLLQIAIERARPQVEQLIINANVDADHFSQYNLPVVADCVAGFAGPLAGILTGMRWAREHLPNCEWIATFACDSPFFPLDLIVRFKSALANQEGDMVCAKSGSQLHPVFGLWPVALYDDLWDTLVNKDIRRMGAWLKTHHYLEVCYDNQPVDPFFNLNTPEDFSRAKELS